MTVASEDALLGYFASVVERLDQLAVTLVPSDEDDTVEIERTAKGGLQVNLLGVFPAIDRHAPGVEIVIVEVWDLIAPDTYSLTGYTYELRNHEIGFRRAFHRHDVDHFVATIGVATHEHCETVLGVATCGHYAGLPVSDAFDAIIRLGDLWATGAQPDCRTLVCLG